MKKFILVSFFAVAAQTLLSQNAVIRHDLNGSIIAGYGFESSLNLGFGVRGGKTLAQNPIYLGGVFVYHFGSSSESTSSLFGATATTKTSFNNYYFGGEAGYDFVYQEFLLRPSLILGAMVGNASVEVSGSSAVSSTNAESSGSGSSFLFSMGFMGMKKVNFLNDGFIGAEARLHIVDGFTAFALHFTIGKYF